MEEEEGEKLLTETDRKRIINSETRAFQLATTQSGVFILFQDFLNWVGQKIEGLPNHWACMKKIKTQPIARIFYCLGGGLDSNYVLAFMYTHFGELPTFLGTGTGRVFPKKNSKRVRTITMVSLSFLHTIHSVLMSVLAISGERFGKSCYLGLYLGGEEVLMF